MKPIEGHARGWILLVLSILAIMLMMVTAQTCALGNHTVPSAVLNR